MHKQVNKMASYHNHDFDGGIRRDWYKLGRKVFGVTDDGELLALDGSVMAHVDDGCNVTQVFDKDAYRAADAIRAYKADSAEMAANMERFKRWLPDSPIPSLH